MNEEDEAFEDLAKRQGDWGMQGSRKHQILRYAENVESKGTSMTDKKTMAMALEVLECANSLNRDYENEIAALKERLAQPEQTEVQQLIALVRAQQITIDKLEMALADHPMREVQRLGQEIEQEPVAWKWRVKNFCDWPNWSVSLKRPADSGHAQDPRTEGYEDIPLYTTPPAQPAQPEPIISLQCANCQVTIETLNDKVMQLMAERTWVELTDEQMMECDMDEDGLVTSRVRAKLNVQAKLKENK